MSMIAKADIPSGKGGIFEIKYIEFHKLERKESVEENGRYVSLEYGEWKFQTETRNEADESPRWEFKPFLFFESDATEIEDTFLKVALMDTNASDIAIGKTSISLESIASIPGVRRELDLMLTSDEGKKTGRVRIAVAYRENPSKEKIAGVLASGEFLKNMSTSLDSRLKAAHEGIKSAAVTMDSQLKAAHENIKTTVGKAASTMDDGYQKTIGGIKAAGENVKSSVAQAATSMDDSLRLAQEGVKNTINKTTEGVKDVTMKTVEMTRDTISKTTEGVKDVTMKTVEMTRDGVRSVAATSMAMASGDLLLKNILADKNTTQKPAKLGWGELDQMINTSYGKDKTTANEYDLKELGDFDPSQSAPLSRGGSITNLSLHGDDDDDDAYFDESDTQRGKIRWREGRYKLGRKQFMANPYIFIPGKLMLSPSFNFSSIFKDLKLTVPSLIFRLSRALKTSTWNVKLPPSRKYLMEAFKVLHDTEIKQGGNTNPVKRNPKHADLLIAANAPPPTSEDEHVINLRGAIDHYHKVLDENCRRLLRSTNAACIQAQTIYRVNEIWSDDCAEDVVAEWAQASNPKGPMPHILGIADKTDFHESVWKQLREGCVENYAQREKDNSEPAEVVIDPEPFFDKRIPVTYHPITGHPTKSIPHPAITHLIISDNRILLEQKIAEVVLWGVILMNGGIREAELGAQAVQLGLPMVAFKYTGGAADIIIEMSEKVDKWVNQKRAKQLVAGELPPRPFPDDIQVGYLPPQWLMPFDQSTIVVCTMLNKLIENWPDRFNKESVFCIDMFETPEDEVQDRLTLTVGVVSGGDYELGGVASEQKRISYAWRCRHKFLYNALIYLIIADLLQILITIFTALSTFAATLYTFLAFSNSTRLMPPNLQPLSEETYKQTTVILLFINIVVPLIGTVTRGINAAISPYMKYVVLTNACVKIEGEVYTFRCKVGQYSAMKQSDDDEDEEEEEGGDGDGGDDANDDAGLPNPRKFFYQAIDRVWSDLSASDLQNGTLRAPPFPTAALDDINARLRNNRKEQLTYLIPMQRKGGQGGGDDPKKGKDEVEVKKSHGLFDTIRSILAHGAKISALGSDEVRLDDGVSPLSADDYVILRVIPMAAYMTKQAPMYSWLRIISQALGVIFSVMASALTAFQLIAFIPAVLALAGAMSTMTQYWQIDLRLLQTNAARSQLHQVLAWWESLTLIEKRVPANKTKLVKTVEATIQAQATVFQGGGSGGGDDEGSEEEKK